MRVGSLYTRIPSSTHYGLVLVSRSVSTWEICQDHFAQCTLRDCLQESQGSDGMSRVGPPSPFQIDGETSSNSLFRARNVLSGIS